LVIPSAVSVGLDLLCSHYFTHFAVSSGALAVARRYRHKLPDSVWQEIGQLQFTSTVRYELEGIKGIPDHTVVQIIGPETEVRLVQWPIHVLTDVVGQLSRYWQTICQVTSPDKVHHDHRCEWEFLAWIDMIVARAHGFYLVGNAGMSENPYDYDIDSVGRFESFRGPIPSTDNDLAMVQLASRLRNRPRHNFFDREEPA
jgi:hypothetical protein